MSRFDGRLAGRVSVPSCPRHSSVFLRFPMLKSLEIFGFKSFADRLRFDFAAGITGVVGPNGSGKSNVVDSIKWILGDQSAKSLRGKEMTDVIFNGASNRKPSRLRRSDADFRQLVRLPADCRAAKCKSAGGFTARARPNTSSTARRPASRTSAICCMGTGAGSANYCIIEQGRVDQILQANVSARRMVFEEAAGISRFKSRKVDAERKLERVDQNVSRLTDIVDEVEAQLNTIRSQAVKAAKYRQDLRTAARIVAGTERRPAPRAIRSLWPRSNGHSPKSRRMLEGFNGRLAEIESVLSGLDAGELPRSTIGCARSSASGRRTAKRRPATKRRPAIRPRRLREMDADLVRLRRQRAMIQTAARARPIAAARRFSSRPGACRSN